MKAFPLLLAVTQQAVTAFQPIHQHQRQLHLCSIQPHQRILSPLRVIQQDEDTAAPTATSGSEAGIPDEAVRLRREAELIRLQAEQMDLSLTLKKIEALESKLKNAAWLEKHPDQEADLQMQLQRLNDKLTRGPNDSVELAKPATTSSTTPSNPSIESSKSESSQRKPKIEESVKAPKFSQYEPKKKRKIPETPLAGFDQADLDLYIPIAEEINAKLPDSSMTEKLEVFRTAPELQAHFQEKIQKMLVGPLEEMQRLETLKKEYLDSNSSKEREQLKRQIDQLESSEDEDGPFMYSDGFYCDAIIPLSEEDLEKRVAAVTALPDILIAIYKQRNGMGEDDDLRLTVLMDYYEPQLQLLDQVRAVSPLTDEMREQYVQGFNSLPEPVRYNFATKCGLPEDSDAKAVLAAALGRSTALSPLMQVVEASNTQSLEPAEYNDIEFVDRSRYLEEFLPSVGNMEGKHPSLESVEEFAQEILDRKTFMMTSKPERVSGGYYIRGTNQFEDAEDGSSTAAEKLVAEVTKKMDSSLLGKQLEFFYILDPAPPTEEEMEFGPTEKPIFLITTKDPDSMYNWAKVPTKLGITATGILTTFMFSIGACALNPGIYDRFSGSLDSASSSGYLDLQWLADLCFPLFTSLLAIQLVHEVAHRAIALRDEVSH